MSEILKRVEQMLKPIIGMVEFVTDIAIDADGKFTALGAKSDDDDGHPIKGDTGWHLGFYSRPLDGGTGAVVKPGGKSGAAFLFCWRNRQYEVALQKGEVAMANEAGAVVKLDKDGQILADAKAGQKIKLQGGGKGVARLDDTTDGGTLVFFPGTAGASLSYIPPGGVVTPPVAPTINIPISGKINSASTKSETG